MTSEEFLNDMVSWWDLLDFCNEHQVGRFYDRTGYDSDDLLDVLRDRVSNCGYPSEADGIFDDLDLYAEFWVCDDYGEWYSYRDNDFDDVRNDILNDAIEEGIIIDETEEEREAREQREAEEYAEMVRQQNELKRQQEAEQEAIRMSFLQDLSALMSVAG